MPALPLPRYDVVLVLGVGCCELCVNKAGGVLLRRGGTARAAGILQPPGTLKYARGVPPRIISVSLVSLSKLFLSFDRPVI